MNVESSEDHGIVSFGWGQCTMQAASGILILRAEAGVRKTTSESKGSSPGTSAGSADATHLKVNWLRPGTSSAQPGNR